jgi:hypothetical protein
MQVSTRPYYCAISITGAARDVPRNFADYFIC